MCKIKTYIIGASADGTYKTAQNGRYSLILPPSCKLIKRVMAVARPRGGPVAISLKKPYDAFVSVSFKTPYSFELPMLWATSPLHFNQHSVEVNQETYGTMTVVVKENAAYSPLDVKIIIEY